MTNALAHETSPYLLQHKDNPVNWYPWGQEALDRAKAENKPILLSIGYSACHWCHVMAHECFENEEIARLMNENFINVKVDREERPDLDHIYQNVAQAFTQGGGWPLTVFLTPDLKPFFGGTYFPPVDKYGRPGLPKILVALSDAFKNSPADVAENAERLVSYISSLESVSSTPGKAPSRESLEKAAERLLARMDWENGGFAGAPKFPNTTAFTFLWRMEKREAVILTLRKMAQGGVYDRVGGGFHRYSIDETWSVPHYEKMLYDNALLLKLYSEVLLNAESHLSQKDRELFMKIVAGTAEYVLREMRSKEGAFHSAQDADSEGEEGKYYLYGDTDLESRAKRTPPLTDTKILTGWNALMISGLAWASLALASSRESDAAKMAFDFLVQNLSTGEGRLFSSFQGGKPRFNAYLDDYAFLAMAALDLARVSEAPDEIERYASLSRQWVDVIAKHFKDPLSPGFFFTSDDHEALIQRPKTIFDQAVPSGTAIALECMIALGENENESESRLSSLFSAAIDHPHGYGEILNTALLSALGAVTVSGPGKTEFCRHPHFFRIPTQTGQEEQWVFCHKKTCYLRPQLSGVFPQAWPPSEPKPGSARDEPLGE